MKATIARLAGDGIGPEIMDEGVKVLNSISSVFGHEFELQSAPIGGFAIDKTGNPYPDETHQSCLEADAVLFGAIGDPKYDNDPNARVRPEQGLLAMRQKLGLYANLRPVKTFPALYDRSPLKTDRLIGVDFLVVRELTGGIYFGEPRGLTENGEKAFDTCVYTSEEVQRVAKMAIELARKRSGKLCAVDKANVLATSRLWRREIQKLASENTDIDVEYLFVDNASMQLILRPNQFDVIVTENMFGDILTDEASVLPGSIGLLPSASVGDSTAVFEPIHGSFPEGAGKGIANPFGMIRSVALMLDIQFGLKKEAGLIEEAIEAALSGKIMWYSLSCLFTMVKFLLQERIKPDKNNRIRLFIKGLTMVSFIFRIIGKISLRKYENKRN